MEFCLCLQQPFAIGRASPTKIRQKHGSLGKEGREVKHLDVELLNSMCFFSRMLRLHVAFLDAHEEVELPSQAHK